MVPVPSASQAPSQDQPRGAPGNYDIIFTFSRPGASPTSEYSHCLGEGLEGDSHILLSQTVAITVQEPDGRQALLEAQPNVRGYLSKIRMAGLFAESLMDAERRSYRALAPLLSNWSVYLNVPVFIFQIDVRECATGKHQFSIVNPFLEAPLVAPRTGEMSAEFRSYASLYREALNTNNPLYRFLCFFKILESVRVRRARLAARARGRGDTFARPSEAVPDDPEKFVAWLESFFPVTRNWDDLALASVFLREALGRRVNSIVDDFLQPLRVRIAHALTDDHGELPQSSDQEFVVGDVNRWLPLTQCLVRLQLKNEFPGEFTVGDRAAEAN